MSIVEVKYASNERDGENMKYPSHFWKVSLKPDSSLLYPVMLSGYFCCCLCSLFTAVVYLCLCCLGLQLILGGRNAAEMRFDHKFFEKFRAQNIVEAAVDYARVLVFVGVSGPCTCSCFYGTPVMSRF